jgi:hypothetical protein
MKFLYDRHGEPRAFLEGPYIYDLQGYACGRVEGDQVYRMDGQHVGALHEDMVVDAMTSSPGPIEPPLDPGRVPPPDSPGPRGAFEYGLPDRIDALF